MAQQVFPERCNTAGQFFGGTFGYGGANKRSGRLAGVGIIPESVTADTATELELLDADWSNSALQESKKRQMFRINKSADDGVSYYNIDPPIKFSDGIQVKTHTNCRVALYVE